MNASRNDTVKWLQYLLYAGFAALVNSLIGYTALLSSLTRWVGLAINAGSIYLLLQLAKANGRYRSAALFSAVSLVCGQIGGASLILVCSVCGIVAQYQEYHGHSELIGERDAKLAGKWHGLFWAQFAVGLLLGLLVSLFGVILVAINGAGTTLTTTVTSIASSFLTLILKVLYLVYLHRTISLLENEVVVE